MYNTRKQHSLPDRSIRRLDIGHLLLDEFSSEYLYSSSAR